jgi:alpha-tubulin suppressor-like RCC1 family protein/uncharacterized protein YjdB
MTIGARRFAQPIALAIVGALWWLGGCSDSPGGLDCCDPPTPPQGLIISDPVPATAVARGSLVASASTSSAGDDVAYVSLPPGTVPTGNTAIIRRVGDNPLTTTVRDGGFDAVAVVAQAGDSIDVIVRDATGGSVFQLRLAVAAARPPIVVRTDPPRGKTDVPLNAAIVFVFSEPVDASTLTPTSLRLFRGTSTVAGTITLLQGTGAIAAFVPTAPLAANTEYLLEVTQAVRDLDGDALQIGVTATFTTGQSSTGAAASLQVSPLDFSLVVGQTYQMTATVRDAVGNILIDQPVTWSSGVTCSISSTGLVTALSFGESDSVHATLGGLRSAVRVSVSENPPASVEVTPIAATVAVGDTIILTATVRDAAGRSLTHTGVSWSSSAPGVATVDPSGMVKGLSPGSVTVTATSGAVSDSAAVTVGPAVPVASVTVAPDVATVLAQATVQVAATLRDATGRVIGGRPITWSSDDEAVATVDANGLVTGASAGSAAVSATSEGVSGFARITVTIIDFASVSAGGHSTCGLGISGAGYCWGWNYYGQLGNGSTDSSAVPVAVIGGFTFTTVTSGLLNACGVTTTGAAYCWGYNLGNGPISSAVPVPVIGGLTFTTVTLGALYACGLTTTGAAYCWGINDNGQLGNGSTNYSGVPVPVVGELTFTTVTAGGNHACGLSVTGAAYCWGNNDNGQLGNGSTNFSAVPVPVVGGLTFSTVTAGGGHACGLTATGAAYCWGNNGNGQLGNGSTNFSGVPVPVVGGLTFTMVTAGGGHACGLTATGAAYCWGNNDNGQLGNGSTNFSGVPVPVVGGLTFTTVTAGGGHTCGLTATGAAYCWGANGTGQLGDGKFSSSSVPVKVAGQP